MLYRLGGRTELDIIGIRERKAQLKIDQAKKGLDALEVRAPHGGLFSRARWRGVGPAFP